jgi:hypothetical protein
MFDEATAPLRDGFGVFVETPCYGLSHRGVELISDVLPFGRLHALRRTVQCD